MTDALTKWIETNAPELAKSFAAPAASEHVEGAAKAWGRALPQSYVAFLLAHDGQRWIEGETVGVGTLAPIFASFEILGVRHALGEWESMREWDGGDAAEHYFPFTTIGGESTHHAFDREGRVFVVSMKREEHEMIAESFDDFVTRLAAILDEDAEIDEDGIELGDDALDWLLGEP